MFQLLKNNSVIVMLIHKLSLFKFLDTAADEPLEVKHMKTWMKSNNFALLADFSGGELVARYG